MESIRINGEEWANAPKENMLKMTELVELIKSSIDPDQIITGLLINGRELEESDWNSCISNYATNVLEVETNTIDNYIQDRLSICPNVVTQCYMQVRKARKLFQEGESFDANKKLGEAVTSLKAFFNWYATLLNVMPEDQKQKCNIDDQVEKIYDTCKKVCQQQLYQSWWALGELLEKELEPELDALEDILRCNAKGN